MIAALLVAAGAFVATVPWGQHLISWLQSHGVGKHIRIDGPQGHQVKRGTPTMGGILILASVLVFGGLLALNTPRLWAPIAVTFLFALLGAYDDIQGLRDRAGVGWLARWKLPWQFALALAGAAGLYMAGAPRVVSIPLLHASVYVGVAFIPLAAVVIVAMANAVNFTDGLDGQAAGTSALAYIGFALIVLTAEVVDLPLALLCAVYVGATLAFLWHNVHPARMFMGDTGSMALGAGLAAVALMTDQWLLLPVVGAVFVAEVLSVIVQVLYFKATHGRRFFRMAPLHHHLELCGWQETQVSLRFSIVTAVLAMLGVALASIR